MTGILEAGKLWIFAGAYQRGVAGVLHGSPVQVLQGVLDFPKSPLYRAAFFAFADYEVDQRDIDGMPPQLKPFFTKPQAPGILPEKRILEILRRANVQDVRLRR